MPDKTLTYSPRFTLDGSIGGKNEHVFGRAMGAEEVYLTVYSAVGANVTIYGRLPEGNEVILFNGGLSTPGMVINNGGMYQSLRIRRFGGTVDCQFSAKF